MRCGRRLPLLAFLALGLPWPAGAHQGPPFPILVDRHAGPYIASVWTDPDIGTGTFFVILKAPEGRNLPARTRVSVGVQPASGMHGETVFEATSQPVDEGARYFAAVPFAHGGMWRVRVRLDGSEGGGTLAAEVEATPDGTIGPIGLVVYLVPFLAIGFLWLKAAVRRREKSIEKP
ncbi:MAG TPA: hypothetical protein VIC28_04810 [Thermoanaerobaculia bacterium]